jgi:AraC-like DNA-binding protein
MRSPPSQSHLTCPHPEVGRTVSVDLGTLHHMGSVQLTSWRSASRAFLPCGFERAWGSADGVESYFERLNALAPVSRREVQVQRGGHAALTQTVVVHRDSHGRPYSEHPSSRLPQCFVGESRSSDFELIIDFERPEAAPLSYSIGLPLAGDITMRLQGQTLTIPAGAGALVDPAHLEHSRLPAGFHMVEVFLLKRDMARLAAEWQPGLDGRHLRFEPLLSPSLARRVLFMATQAAALLESAAGTPGAAMMFRRWADMIGLTLLTEQARLGEAAPRAAAVMIPAIRRALDYMHAHADAPIGLADIAEAAHLSVSTLTRQFSAALGQTPYAALRDIRLERAREDIKSKPQLLVRDIALCWGFQNPSKFSSAYLQRYGERPTDTRGRKD